jgi:signal transduction histidine kinase
MFNLMRHYAITSLVGVFVAAVLLTAFYRQLEIDETVHSARIANIALTEAVLDSVRQDVAEYLVSVADLGPREIRNAPFPPQLVPAIAETMRRTSITKVRIYNNRGVIAYSTDRQERGSTDSANPGFAAASMGQSASEITYRDAFSVLGQRTDESNLVRTYVPVRLRPAEPVRGALATYVDLSPAVAQTEHEVYTVIGGIALIMMLLYSSQLLVVLRAQKVIDAQQDTIRERTATLESLSLQRLAGEEAEKLDLAHSLHEGLAQTLSAIKIGIENSLERNPGDLAHDNSLRTALSSLQGAIDEVQEMAADLRPSSLDELGLLPTIRWFCREFERLHPDVRIEQQILVQEQDIPEQLKIVIYRIVEAVLKDIGKNTHQDRIRLRLLPNAQAIMLAIDDIPQESTSIETAPDTPRRRFAAAQERATLSGGAFTAAFNREGGITLNASWVV